MAFEVVRDTEVSIPQFQAEPFRLGDVIPDDAFDISVCPNRNLKNALLNLKRIRPVEEPGTTLDSGIREQSAGHEWPIHQGGPWFLTPDGQKHRGKKRALAHMGVT